MINTIIFFTVITLINVILSTTRSVLTIKATKGKAAIINAISFGFYTLVVKQMANVSTEIVVITTIVCNLIGVYFSKWIIDKFQKDILWKITVIPKKFHFEAMKEVLISAKISFYEYRINSEGKLTNAFDIFSENQKESAIIREILENFDSVKYYVLPIEKTL